MRATVRDILKELVDLPSVDMLDKVTLSFLLWVNVKCPSSEISIFTLSKLEARSVKVITLFSKINYKRKPIINLLLQFPWVFKLFRHAVKKKRWRNYVSLKTKKKILLTFVRPINLSQWIMVPGRLWSAKFSTSVWILVCCWLDVLFYGMPILFRVI